MKINTRAMRGVAGLMEDRICPFCMTRSLVEEVGELFCRECGLFMHQHLLKAVEVYAENLVGADRWLAYTARASDRGVRRRFLLPQKGAKHHEKQL